MVVNCFYAWVVNQCHKVVVQLKTKLVNSANPFYEGLYGLLTFVMECHKNTVNVLILNYNLLRVI